METAISRIDPSGMSLSLNDAQSLASTLAKSGLMPEALRKNPADILVVILTGKELGLGPMQSVRSINVIKGKATMSAELMVALCKRSPDCEYLRLVESTPVAATYETRRRGDPEPTRMSYTIKDAQAAELTGNPTWKKHPAAMLRARCASAISRAVYPDMLLGVYSDDEGEEIARNNRPASPEEGGLERKLMDSIAAAEEKKRAKELIDQATENLGGEVVDGEFEQPEEEVEFRMPFASRDGHWDKGDPISDLEDGHLKGLINWKKVSPELKDACEAELERRSHQ